VNRVRERRKRNRTNQADANESARREPNVCDPKQELRTGAERESGVNQCKMCVREEPN